MKVRPKLWLLLVGSESRSRTCCLHASSSCARHLLSLILLCFSFPTTSSCVLANSPSTARSSILLSSSPSSSLLSLSYIPNCSSICFGFVSLFHPPPPPHQWGPTGPCAQRKPREGGREGGLLMGMSEKKSQFVVMEARPVYEPPRLTVGGRTIKTRPPGGGGGRMGGGGAAEAAARFAGGGGGGWR